MQQILEHKKDILLVFLIGFSLAIMAIYQTYAYDINSNLLTTNRPSPDLKYTINVSLDNNLPYTITINPGETKLLDLTLENKNNINLKYLLYTTEEIKDNTLLAVLNTSNNNASGVISKESKAVVSLVIINKTNSALTYDLNVLSGYENGGTLTPPKGTAITTTYSFPNSPELDDNMIPIVYDEDLSSWVVADITNTDYKYYWYEYALKRWANIAIIDKKDILDISNHENTGFNNNATIDNGTVILDKQDSYIDCNLKNYDFSNSLTTVIRTKITGLNGESTIISNLDNGGFSLYLTSDSYLAIKIYSKEDNTIHDLKSNYQVSLNDWYTIVFKYDNGNPSLYVNGNAAELANNSKLKGIKISSSSLTLGKSNYQGKVNNFLIFTSALSEETIQKYFSKNLNTTNIINDLNNSNNNLLLYYDFSEGQNIPIGTIIKENPSQDNSLTILSYYTWIPRYKYKVWNLEKQSGLKEVDLDTGTYKPQEQGIDIIFEEGIATTGEITCNYNNQAPTTEAMLSEICLGTNGEYYTHPAFKLGTTEVSGLWVGKFASTLDNNNNLIIKNNQINNLVNHNISEALSYTTSLLDNSSYNFSSNIDAHLIKNLEWGSITYLTHSNYGLCTNNNCSVISKNTYLNSQNQYQTGCGTSDNATTCLNYDTKDGQKSSSTGNIYGIYDLSGTAAAYVMSNITDKSLTISEAGNNLLSLNSRYYDTYPLITDNNPYSQLSLNRSHLGDAIGEISLDTSKETGGWYGSNLNLGTNSWLTRGGNNQTNFSLNTATGGADPNIGFRNILIKNNKN